MSEFEMGMMAGWAAGVATAGVVAGVLDWWRGRNRVVTIHTGYQPSPPIRQVSPLNAGYQGKKTALAGKVECCVCDGTGVRPHFPGNGYKGPNTIQCGLCKGTGWMTLPPKD